MKDADQKPSDANDEQPPSQDEEPTAEQSEDEAPQPATEEPQAEEPETAEPEQAEPEEGRAASVWRGRLKCSSCATPFQPPVQVCPACRSRLAPFPLARCERCEGPLVRTLDRSRPPIVIGTAAAALLLAIAWLVTGFGSWEADAAQRFQSVLELTTFGIVLDAPVDWLAVLSAVFLHWGVFAPLLLKGRFPWVRCLSCGHGRILKTSEQRAWEELLAAHDRIGWSDDEPGDAPDAAAVGQGA